MPKISSYAGSRLMFVKSRRCQLRAAQAQNQRPYQPAEQKYQDEDRQSCKPEGEDPYERNNRWMLDAASRFGPDKVDFVCLWNGEGVDGPGGTRHMMEEVSQRGGRTHWLDTTKLWG